MRSAIRSWRHRSGRQCAHRGAQRLDGPPAGARGRTAKGRTGCARSTLLWTSLALAFLAGPLAPRSQAQAPGGDAYFVDAVHGSDQNPGTSPESAWCTVEHAVTMLRSPRASTTLHLAPGVYPASRLAPSGQLIVVGAGVEHTVLEGTARTPLFDLHAGDQDGEAQVSLFRVEGATLRGGSAGVRLRASSSVAVQLQDVVIEDCHVAVDLATETGPAGPGTIVARLERASVRGGGTGVLAVGAEGDLDVQVLDSELRGAAADGIRTRGSVRLHVERCRVVENRANGIDAQPLFKNLVRVEVRDSLIAANHRAGFRGDRTDPPFGRTEALFANVTVTGNCHEGILAPHEGTTTIEGSIVYGNLGTDLVLGPPGVETIRSNVLSDEDLDGVNDNIVADPLFRDAETGDYRLTFGSPAVDSLDVVPGLDVDRRPRGTDGDLDIVRRSDRGAFELEPFEMLGARQLGGQVELAFAGEPGASTVLLLSGRGLQEPTPTPFGDAYRPFWRASLSMKAGPGPVTHPFQLRTPSSLVGTTISMQALTTSSAAPAGRAYTNAIEFVLEP